MAKAQDIKKFVSETLEDFLKENGLELYHVDFKKEGKDWNLNVILDKLQNDPNGETLYISSEDCEIVSRYLEEKLDQEDPISQNYTLTVSSPGLDRELFEPKDYLRFRGSLVEVRLYQAVNGKKEWLGTLLDFQDDVVTIQEEEGEEISFPLTQVAKTNLAFVF